MKSFRTVFDREAFLELFVVILIQHQETIELALVDGCGVT